MRIFQDVQGLHILDCHSLTDVMGMGAFVRIQLQEKLSPISCFGHNADENAAGTTIVVWPTPPMMSLSVKSRDPRQYR